MDKVRVLPWIEHTPHWVCSTNVGRYHLNSSGSLAGYDVHRGPTYLGFYQTLELAMDAAEADYLDRITEFVPALKPGQVGVSESFLRQSVKTLRTVNKVLSKHLLRHSMIEDLIEDLERLAGFVPTPAPDAETEDKAGGKTDD